MMPIQMIDKQTYVLQAVQNVLNSNFSNEGKLNWIEVITRESIAEFAPQIAAIKARLTIEAM